MGESQMATETRGKGASKKGVKPKVEFEANHGIVTLFSDGINLGRRSDGTYILRWLSCLPEGNIEQARLALSADVMKKIIDLLCQQADHYPERPGVRKLAAKTGA